MEKRFDFCFLPAMNGESPGASGLSEDVCFGDSSLAGVVKMPDSTTHSPDFSYTFSYSANKRSLEHSEILMFLAESSPSLLLRQQEEPCTVDKQVSDDWQKP